MKFLVLSFVALCVLPSTFAADGGPATFLYANLSAKQRTLFHAYVDSRLGPGDRDESFYESYWGTTLNTGEPTTFAGVTHALEHTSIGGGMTALDEIDHVVAIYGDIPSAPTAQQYNLQIVWKQNAYTDFELAGFTYRIGSGHPGETGLSYLSSTHGLHLLFAKDGTSNGHVHVDYRLWGLADIMGEGEGHMTAGNSDVRAIGPEVDTTTGAPINNFDRHVSWFGDFPGFIRR